MVECHSTHEKTIVRLTDAIINEFTVVVEPLDTSIALTAVLGRIGDLNLAYGAVEAFRNWLEARGRITKAQTAVAHQKG